MRRTRPVVAFHRCLKGPGTNGARLTMQHTSVRYFPDVVEPWLLLAKYPCFNMLDSLYIYKNCTSTLGVESIAAGFLLWRPMGNRS